MAHNYVVCLLALLFPRDWASKRFEVPAARANRASEQQIASSSLKRSDARWIKTRAVAYQANGWAASLPRIAVLAYGLGGSVSYLSGFHQIWKYQRARKYSALS